MYKLQKLIILNQLVWKSTDHNITYTYPQLASPTKNTLFVKATSILFFFMQNSRNYMEVCGVFQTCDMLNSTEHESYPAS